MNRKNYKRPWHLERILLSIPQDNWEKVREDLYQTCPGMWFHSAQHTRSYFNTKLHVYVYPRTEEERTVILLQKEKFETLPKVTK